MKSTGKIWIFYDAVTQKQTRPMSTMQAQLTLLDLKIRDPQRFFLWTPGWEQWVSLQKFIDSDQTYFVFAPAPNPAASIPKPPPPAAAMSPDEELGEKTITKVFDVDTQTGIQMTRVLDDKPASGGSGKADYGYFYDDFSAEKIDPDAKHSLSFNLPGKQKADPRDRRGETRHHFKIEVILINKKGRSFRTFSENISTGGTLLEDELPKDFVNTQFDLILVNKFEKDPLKGRMHFQGRVVGDYMNPRRLMFLETDEHTKKRLEAMLESYMRHQESLRAKKSPGGKKTG